MQNLSNNCPQAPLALEPSVWFFAGQMDDSQEVRRVSLETMPFRVGRRSDLPLTLPCRSVSKDHAEIFERDGCLWVRDLNSTNGTYVGGSRVFAPVKLSEGDIVQFATVVFRVGRDRSDSVDNGTICEDACERALSMMQFDRLLDSDAVIPFFQPIVELGQSDSPCVAYEVLGRSRIMGLTTPNEMFATASQLSLETDLSRIMCKRGIEVARRFATPQSLYVNTHPRELPDNELISSLEEVRNEYLDQPLVLEIHESSITNPRMIRELRDRLVDLNIGLAFDDFGTGKHGWSNWPRSAPTASNWT